MEGKGWCSRIIAYRAAILKYQDRLKGREGYGRTDTSKSRSRGKGIYWNFIRDTDRKKTHHNSNEGVEWNRTEQNRAE